MSKAVGRQVNGGMLVRGCLCVWLLKICAELFHIALCLFSPHFEVSKYHPDLTHSRGPIHHSAGYSLYKQRCPSRYIKWKVCFPHQIQSWKEDKAAPGVFYSFPSRCRMRRCKREELAVTEGKNEISKANYAGMPVMSWLLLKTSKDTVRIPTYKPIMWQKAYEVGYLQTFKPQCQTFRSDNAR